MRKKVANLPRASLFYQFLPPDSVVSAVLFGELGAGLRERGWAVTAYSSNRAFGYDSPSYSRQEMWRGVRIRRLWRPNFRQASSVGRMLNALWMVFRWSALTLDPRIKPDVLVVGTDPILSITVALIWRLFKPKTRIAHWCFDLYPEAAVADGFLNPDGRLFALLHFILKKAYSRCDLIIDIGPCMRDKLSIYGTQAQVATLVPWALDEPRVPAVVNNVERRAIFGDVQLALMYSGNFGRAHSFREILLLARCMRTDKVRLIFSVKGNCEQELRKAVLSDDENISFVSFAEPEKLSARLSAADIHVVSLREEWTGMVVPSKFFGALAAGRPVLFSGSAESAVARWIEQYKVGWVLTPQTVDRVADELRQFMFDVDAKEKINRRCHRVYTEHFSKRIGIDSWDTELRGLISNVDGQNSPRKGADHAVEEEPTNLELRGV